MNNLQEDFEYYLKNQEDLVKKYEGKYLVIKDKKVIDAYDTELAAYESATKQFKAGTFLIQPCMPGEESHTQTFYSRVGI